MCNVEAERVVKGRILADYIPQIVSTVKESCLVKRADEITRHSQVIVVYFNQSYEMQKTTLTRIKLNNSYDVISITKFL